MTASPDLPASLPSLWRSLRLGYRAEPRLMLVSLGMTVLGAIPDALFALWLKLMVGGILDGSRTRILVAAAGMGASTAGTWFLRIVTERVHRRFRDRATVTIETHVARLQATVASIEHHERPEYLDRLAVLRDQVFALNHLYMSLFGILGWVVRLVVTLALLVSIHPALVLLALFAAPALVVAPWRAGAERRADERGASNARLARHLFVLGTTAPPGKEVRVAGVGPLLVRRRREAANRWFTSIWRARWASAAWQALAWGVFAAAYSGAIVFVASGLDAPAGDVLLVLAAGGRLSQYLSAAVGELGFLRGIWLDSARRLAWLEDYAIASLAAADQPAPERIREAIRFEHVSFAYPGTDKVVLNDVSLTLPAGAVVAIVGENGAGKSTLVKLLCRFYEPTSGQITVDGEPLSRIDIQDWRSRLAGAFQDFFRFEFRAQHTVGLGDLDRLEDRPAAAAAVGRAGAEDVVGRLAEGMETQLGATWPGGAEISFGQWQKFALARGFMRDRPLLLVLDEPTAALDAETEHGLFERYVEAARDRAREDDGRVTVLVSHRFSTVRMADLIVVLDGAHAVEVGTHEDLLALDGQYADLYRIQAAAYR